MPNKEDTVFLFNYVAQFGPLRFKGRMYLVRVLKEYITHDRSSEHASYQQLITEVAAQHETAIVNVKQAIQRFVKAGWEKGFRWEWEHYVGWQKDTPPDALTAVKLLCESYRPFVAKYKDIIYADRGFYLRPSVITREQKNQKEKGKDDEV